MVPRIGKTNAVSTKSISFLFYPPWCVVCPHTKDDAGAPRRPWKGITDLSRVLAEQKLFKIPLSTCPSISWGFERLKGRSSFLPLDTRLSFTIRRSVTGFSIIIANDGSPSCHPCCTTSLLFTTIKLEDYTEERGCDFSQEDFHRI